MAREDGEGGGDWAAGLRNRLRGMVDAVVDALAAEPIKTGDVAGLDRRARAIASLARAGRAVDALTPRAKTPRANLSRAHGADGGEEDAMSEDSDDIDPTELARLRVEAKSRLDHLRAGFEGKRMVGLPVADAGAGGDRSDAPAAPASARAG